MGKFLFLFFSTSLVNLSFTSLNTCSAQNHLINSKKSTACNICLIEDLIDNLEYQLIVMGVQGVNSEVEKHKFDSLVLQKVEILEAYKKQLGAEYQSLDLEYEALKECMSNYSFVKVKKSKRLELLLSFDAYYRNLDIPTPNDKVMSLKDFEKEENGKYKYYVRGQKFNLSLKELESQIENMNRSLVELNDYRKTKTDYFCQLYSGENFSQMDKTQQLMFIRHLQESLIVTYNLEFSEREKKIEDIRNEDIKLQKLKNNYLESTKVSN